MNLNIPVTQLQQLLTQPNLIHPCPHDPSIISYMLIFN